MNRPESPDTSAKPKCFFTASRAHRKGTLSAPDYADLVVRHLSGLRHSDDKKGTASADDGMLVKAARLCMWDPEWPGSIAPDLMRRMLVASANPDVTTRASLAELDNTSAVLENPLAVQLLVVFSMVNRNKALAKSLILALESPPPQARDVFSTPRHIFGTPKVHHPCLPVDSACDVWTVLLEAGWADVHPMMMHWATACRPPADGVAFADTLLAKGVTVDQEAIETAVREGSCEIIRHLLKHHPPTGPKQEHDLLRYAAERHAAIIPAVSEVFQTLFDSGIRDINWIDPGEHMHYLLTKMPLFNGREMADEWCYYTPQATLLHAAVLNGSPETIKWLIGQGATIQEDGWGRNPLDTAMYLQREEAVEVLKKLGVEATPKGQYMDPYGTLEKARKIKWEEREAANKPKKS